MSSYPAVALTGMRAVALIGILPGAIVAAAYLLVLTQHLYERWDGRAALILGMAVWGVLGVIELWHEYVRLSRNLVGAERPPVTPRVVVLVWALILAAIAAWKADTHPWTAAFLVIAALYALGRAFGLLSYIRRTTPASPRPAVARSSSAERARPRPRLRAEERARPPVGERPRARPSRVRA
jgi:hypothetical protein